MAEKERKRIVTRVSFEDPRDEKGMVIVVIPEGTPVLNAKRNFRTNWTADTYAIRIPEELLSDSPEISTVGPDD